MRKTGRTGKASTTGPTAITIREPFRTVSGMGRDTSETTKQRSSIKVSIETIKSVDMGKLAMKIV